MSSHGGAVGNTLIFIMENLLQVGTLAAENDGLRTTTLTNIITAKQAIVHSEVSIWSRREKQPVSSLLSRQLSSSTFGVHHQPNRVDSAPQMLPLDFYPLHVNSLRLETQHRGALTARKTPRAAARRGPSWSWQCSRPT